jgi:hypothetical protein
MTGIVYIVVGYPSDLVMSIGRAAWKRTNRQAEAVMVGGVSQGTGSL